MEAHGFVWQFPAVIALAVSILLLAPAVTHASSACHIRTARGLTVPDHACTPGAYDRLSRSDVCTSKDRPYLPAADRRLVVSEYDVPGWSGADGELDHLVPFFLGGRTVEDNIWPQPDENHWPGYRNAKDRLEFRVQRRVCAGDPYRLRVVSALRIFLHDWRATYRSWRYLRIL